MSYLNSPRLTFSGKFQSDVSTVNNDPNHFNNATFQPSYQEYRDGKNANGWWNPDGTGNFRLIDLRIESVTYLDGTSTKDPKVDPIIGMNVMDTESRVAGKMVDLDTQQQMVSEIWGLIVRIGQGETSYVKGDYEVAAFTNIWFNRSTDKTADAGAAASYQSVIKNLEWNIEQSNSRYLKELKDASQDALSIQFTVDRYNGDHTSPEFTIGRMAGNIGPAYKEEPMHHISGRQLFPQVSTVNYAMAIVDDELKKVVMNFSNSLQFGIAPEKPLDIIDAEGKVEKIAKAGVGIVETANLVLAINTGTPGNPDYNYIGKVNYDTPGWYEQESGICSFDLTDEQYEQVQSNPLVILDYSASQTNVFGLNESVTIMFQEQPNYVVADTYVYRMNPSEKAKVKFYATQFGKPLADASVITRFDTVNLLQAPDNPPLGVPANALKFSAAITTNEKGIGTLELKAGDPGNPRDFIDGQIYAINYNLEGDFFANCNQSNFISVLVFDSVDPKIIAAPTWADLQPVMQLFSNLYPIMSKGIFKLAQREVVDEHAKILKFVFAKDVSDSNYMPVTRDLSKDKQQMILTYLTKVLEEKEQNELNA
ncbi:MAG: hypothetical protein ACI9YE_003428 [Psychroserpens sp.]|jgi:hypothetical protein